MPEFLHELNIGQVYIAGDSLIYCGGDRQTLHSEKKKKSLDFFFLTPQLGTGRIPECHRGRAYVNTGTVLVINCSSQEKKNATMNSMIIHILVPGLAYDQTFRQRAKQSAKEKL